MEPSCDLTFHIRKSVVVVGFGRKRNQAKKGNTKKLGFGLALFCNKFNF
jgi:hypothetical protein